MSEVVINVSTPRPIDCKVGTKTKQSDNGFNYSAGFHLETGRTTTKRKPVHTGPEICINIVNGDGIQSQDVRTVTIIDNGDGTYKLDLVKTEQVESSMEKL